MPPFTTVRIDTSAIKAEDGTYTGSVNVYYMGEIYMQLQEYGFATPEEARQDAEDRLEDALECRIMQDFRNHIDGNVVEPDWTGLLTAGEYAEFFGGEG